MAPNTDVPTPTLRLRHEGDRAERLLAITGAIADAVSDDEVFEALVDRMCDVLSASSVRLWLVDEDGSTARLVRARGYPDGARRHLATVAIDSTPSFPALDSIRRGQPIWLASQAALFEQYPHLRHVASAGRAYRIACLPLLAHGRVLGTLGITIEEEREAGEAERELLQVIARYAGQAVERLRLLEAERHARAEADAAVERLGILNRASRAFADPDLELAPRLRAVVGELARALGSCIAVALIGDDGLLRFNAVYHPDPEAHALLSAALPEQPMRVGEGITGSIAATGESVLLPTIDPPTMVALAAPSHRAVLERFPVYAIVGAALRVRGRIIGTVTAARVRPGGPYTPEDLRLLEELAERAAVAIENSRLYEESVGARWRAELLYRFAQAIVAADRIDAVYATALRSIGAAMGADRSSILTCDAEGVMRFRAWQELSDAYRSRAEGHSPWAPDAIAPRPVLVEDVAHDRELADYLPLFRSEGIGALAFIPLVASGKLIGKFMVYYRAPHRFAAHEVETALAIANHLATVIVRFEAVTSLEETVRQNELFAGVLAHDLRNPLGAILTAAQLLLMRSEGATGREGRTLSRILSSGQRMAAMIDQLLDFTRARSGGGIAIEPSPANLASLCRQAAAELELAHPHWSIVRDDRGSLEGTWDADRMLQVVSNLVANAGQHGRRDAPVTVGLDGTDPRTVRISVHNEGVIAASLLPHLFDPFRSAEHRRAGARGLGLGLYIVREIVTAHGGTVEVTSSESAGTTFSIVLPRHCVPAPTRDAAAVPQPTAGLGPCDGAQEARSILVVDDDRDIREALAESLEDRGFVVETAANGQEALDHLRRAGPLPAAILLDLMMPIMDGYGFLDARRREPALARIPVVVITAGHGVDRSRLGDATQVVPKPIKLANLMRTLERLDLEVKPS